MLEGKKITRRFYQAANQSAISQYLLQQAGGSKHLQVLWQFLKVAHTHISVPVFTLHTTKTSCQPKCPGKHQTQQGISMLWTVRTTGGLSTTALSCVPCTNHGLLCNYSLISGGFRVEHASPEI